MLRSRVVLFLLLALAASGLLESARAADVSGTITTQTWTKANSPYHATGTVTVPAGNTLTIEPGVDVLFDSTAQFVVNGTLNAVGTEADSIRFQAGQAPVWGGVRITGGTGSTVSYTRISGVGGVTDGGALCVTGSGTQLSVSHVVVSANQSVGVYLSDGNLILTDCTISDNTQVGVYNEGTLTMVQCAISRNTGEGLANGPLDRSYDRAASVRYCVISENSTGVWNKKGYVTIENCTISGNGTGLSNASTLTVTKTLIANNRSYGVFHYAKYWALSLTDCTISGNSGVAVFNYGETVTLTRCLVVGNTSSSSMIENYAAIDRGASLIIRNCTITGNSSSGQSLIKSSRFVGQPKGSGYSNLTVQNTIVWGNIAAKQIDNVNGQATVTYSDIQQESGVFAGTGNINADPLFIDPGTDRMRLHSTSPCRDAGDPASPLDPDGSRADMGARPFDPTLTVESPRVPLRFLVMQNAPNPFNPSTTIRFTLPEAGHVTLAVYDINGRLVRMLVGQTLLPGHHEGVWDGYDAVGRAVASGVYVYRLTAKQGVVTKRMVLVR